MVTFDFSVAQSGECSNLVITDNNIISDPDIVVIKTLKFTDAFTGETIEVNTIDFQPIDDIVVIPYNLPDGQYSVVYTIVEQDGENPAVAYNSVAVQQFFDCNSNCCIQKMLYKLVSCTDCTESSYNELSLVYTYYKALQQAKIDLASNKFYNLLHCISRICSKYNCNCNCK